MRPDFGTPNVTNGPLFVPQKFTELQLPKIPEPRRNYTPRSGFITMTSVSRSRATPAVDLTPRDLERGRESSLDRRAVRGRSTASPLQRILNCLHQSDEPMSSKDLAAATGLPVHSISSYIGKYRHEHPSHIAVITQTGTNRRLYQWTGPEESAQ